MALEKKFSDFQESECKDRDFLSPIDEDFCPTCEPTPSYKPDTCTHHGAWVDVGAAF